MNQTETAHYNRASSSKFIHPYRPKNQNKNVFLTNFDLIHSLSPLPSAVWSPKPEKRPPHPPASHPANRRQGRRRAHGSLTAMAQPRAVPLLLLLLLLLLTSAAVADDYQWLQDAVSLPGSAASVNKPTARDCAMQCDANKCSGFSYQSSDKTCHLFSADCRGPAADSSQLFTGVYMARNTCPGENTAHGSLCCKSAFHF